jgi:hypothetical protein
MNLYRNSKELTSIEGVLVDKGSLWRLEENRMVLVDDDQYASYETYPHDPYFYKE